MFTIVRCIPVVGTAVSAVEAVGALIEGDGKTFLAKTAQATISGGLDAMFILSGGVSSLVTAPLKVGMVEGGKIAGKKALEKILVNEAGKITTQVAARAFTEFVCDNSNGTTIGSSRGGGGGGGGSGGNSGGKSPSNTKGFYLNII